MSVGFRCEYECGCPRPHACREAAAFSFYYRFGRGSVELVRFCASHVDEGVADLRRFGWRVWNRQAVRAR